MWQAVVSQPFDRSCKVPAPGDPDEELGEFWESNPWDIGPHHNLSGYERNRSYWNVAGSGFVDISYLTAADSDGDGRCSVPADLDQDGRVDLLVRQAGGGPLKVYRNLFPQRHWLKVSLNARRGNRLGIGSRVVARVGDRVLSRELYPVNSYRSQAPTLVHLGLGEATSVDRLEIHWTSGHVQRLPNVAADQHIRVTEGDPEWKTLQPGLSDTP